MIAMDEGAVRLVALQLENRAANLGREAYQVEVKLDPYPVAEVDALADFLHRVRGELLEALGPHAKTPGVAGEPFAEAADLATLRQVAGELAQRAERLHHAATRLGEHGEPFTEGQLDALTDDMTGWRGQLLKALPALAAPPAPAAPAAAPSGDTTTYTGSHSPRTRFAVEDAEAIAAMVSGVLDAAGDGALSSEHRDTLGRARETAEDLAGALVRPRASLSDPGALAGSVALDGVNVLWKWGGTPNEGHIHLFFYRRRPPDGHAVGGGAPERSRGPGISGAYGPAYRRRLVDL